MSKLLSAGLVHRLLDYDLRTGVFTWRERRGRVKAGDVAGTCSHDGIKIRVNGRRYPASHLAVLWMTGKLPSDEINHRDGNITNNRWTNLRSIDRSQKHYNRGKQQNNSVGFKGVTFHKARRKFQAQIRQLATIATSVVSTLRNLLTAPIAERHAKCTANTCEQADRTMDPVC
jgi:Demerecviridae HNH endonuclease